MKPKHARHERECESSEKLRVLSDAKRLRDMLASLLLRDFGIRPTKRSPDDLTHIYNMEVGDKEKFLEICSKYDITRIVDNYPQWFVSFLRERILKEASDLVLYIEIANVFPQTVHECDIRRDYINKSISISLNILSLLEMAYRELPLDLEKMRDEAELINRLVNELKKWRKYGNSLRNKLLNKQKTEITLIISDLVNESQNVSQDFIDSLTEFMLYPYRKRAEEGST